MSDIGSGILMSFDDWYFQNWHIARPIFDRYDARVTFYVGRPQTIKDHHVRMLEDLQNDGHEIGFHSTNHYRIKKYLQTRSLDDYLREEIDEGMEIMRDRGFAPTTFAYPYFDCTPETDDALLTRFDIVRSRGAGGRMWKRLLKSNAVKSVYSLATLDMTTNRLSLDYYRERIAFLKKHGGWGAFSGHDISPFKTGIGAMNCGLDDLCQILRMISKAGLPIRPVRDLATLGSQ